MHHYNQNFCNCYFFIVLTICFPVVPDNRPSSSKHPPIPGDPRNQGGFRGPVQKPEVIVNEIQDNFSYMTSVHDNLRNAKI